MQVRCQFYFATNNVWQTMSTIQKQGKRLFTQMLLCVSEVTTSFLLTEKQHDAAEQW